MLGNCTDYITANARETPDKLALKDATLTLTYAELDGSVTRMALTLRAYGVAVGEIVGVCLPDTVTQVAMLLALARLTWQTAMHRPEFNARWLDHPTHRNALFRGTYSWSASC